mmetsp:Transcript_6341/g.21010  ORF Transcript_6341/g.21010 Transcript_6341/m.21010 type:complete len:250 (-) Transcript_6341:172-921(-)
MKARRYDAEVTLQEVRVHGLCRSHAVSSCDARHGALQSRVVGVRLRKRSEGDGVDAVRPRVAQDFPVHHSHAKVSLEDLDRLDRGRGQDLEVVSVEVGDSQVPRLALPLCGLEGLPNARSFALCPASVVEKEQVGIAGLQLSELSVDIRHCKGGVHRLNAGRVGATAAAWDACRHEYIGSPKAPQLRCDVRPVAVRIEGLDCGAGTCGLEPLRKIVTPHQERRDRSASRQRPGWNFSWRRKGRPAHGED